MTTRTPIHPKVVGGGLGGLLAGAVITLIQTYWIKSTLPGQVTALIYLAIPGILAFAAGYLTPSRSIAPALIESALISQDPVEPIKK